ncbi:MAG: DUF4251 domain-containing protein [Phocaeicola sp.]
MKRTVILALLAIISWITTPSYGQEKEAVTAQVEAALEAKSFTIRVNQAIPQRGQSRMLTSEYSLTVRNDSLFSDLPYFGVSYSVPYGGGKGLQFEAPITEYKRKKGKKGDTKVEIKTRNEEDRYVYSLTIFSNGKSTIYVQPTNRQGITFYGEMEWEE